MPYTFPVTTSTTGDAATVAQLAGIIARPNLLARTFHEMLGLDESRYLSYSLLGGRFETDGTVVIYPSEDPALPDSVETVSAGAEYPLTALSPEQLTMATILKRGHSTLITDEALQQQGREALFRAGNLLAGSLIRDFDRAGLAVLLSKLKTAAASAPWTDAKAFMTDVLTLKARISAVTDGLYVPDRLALSEAAYAKLLPAVLDILPRESNVVTGANWATIAGVTILTSPQAGNLTSPILLDSKMVGGIATGTVTSPGYARIGTVAEVQPIREAKNDAWTVQARSIALPVVTNPGAGLIITGTGL